MKTLLIGGARSGKSTLAARWAQERSDNVCCIVTAQTTDAEMAARIEAHRQERPAHWRVREAPLRLAAALLEENTRDSVLLIDCLTLWSANCLWPPHVAVSDGEEVAADLSGWHAERERFLQALRSTSQECIIVSNEVGTGIVPDNAAARMFRDEHGRLNQAVASLCEAVYLVTAGLALRLK